MAVPERIGRFDVEGRIGGGAFASVWKARDNALDSDVAIKVLSENWLDSADVRARFLAEARLLRRAESDRVVRVHDLGELADGRPYLVMTYADKGTLDQRLADGRFSWRVATDVAIEIGKGLAVLHAAGVLHRDIKPSNILYRSSPGGGDQAMLGDLGLGKLLAEASMLTLAGGTPAYMAPEQATPGAPVSVRTDVYGLASLLYKALTGQTTHTSTTLNAVADPNRPAVTPPSALVGDIPAALDAVVLRSLEPEPDRRHPDAKAFIADLREVLSDRVPAAGLTVAGPTRFTPTPESTMPVAHAAIPQPPARPATPPQGFPPSTPPQGTPPQSTPPQGFSPAAAPQGTPPQSFSPAAPPQGTPPQSFSPAAPPQGTPPQSFSPAAAPQGAQPLGTPPRGVQPRPATPPRGFRPSTPPQTLMYNTQLPPSRPAGPPPSAPEQPAQSRPAPRKRRRWLIPVVATVVLLALAGAAGVWYYFKQPVDVINSSNEIKVSVPRPWAEESQDGWQPSILTGAANNTVGPGLLVAQSAAEFARTDSDKPGIFVGLLPKGTTLDKQKFTTAVTVKGCSPGSHPVQLAPPAVSLVQQCGNLIMNDFLITTPDGRQAWVRTKQPASDSTNPADLLKSITFNPPA